MANIEKAWRYQEVTCWYKVGVDAYSEPIVSQPIQLNVRWQLVHEEVVNAKGDTIALESKVVVDRDIPEGSIFWFGELSDWYGTGSNNGDLELMQVVTINKATNIKGRHIRRVLGLMRRSDPLPTII